MYPELLLKYRIYLGIFQILKEGGHIFVLIDILGHLLNVSFVLGAIGDCGRNLGGEKNLEELYAC